MVKIKVVPELAIIDEEVDITVTEIKPDSALTVSVSIVWFDVLYIGFGHFYSDVNGCLNIKKHISYGGTYTGLQSMGLFSSMRAMPSKLACPRMIIKGSVDKRLPYEISVWKGHLTQDQVHQLHVKYASFGTDAPVTTFHKTFFLANSHMERTYMSSKVKRIVIKVDIENEHIRGALFVPHGPGPFPGVIDLFGVDGGCTEFRSALLAKHGFASLALAYFGYEGLKATTISKIVMSYFDSAIEWFSNHKLVKPGGVSMIGSSLGARVVLLSCFRNSNVNSTICINASYFIASNPNIKYFTLPIDPAHEIYHGYMTAVAGLKYDSPRPILHHKHDNPILFLVGELDSYGSSLDDVMEQLRMSGKKNISKVIIEGQGHFIEPPYTPMCTSTSAFRSGTTKSDDPYKRLRDDVLQEWGGCYEKHGRGQLEAWHIVLDFLRKNTQRSKI